jgi:hypothetical protein
MTLLLCGSGRSQILWLSNRRNLCLHVLKIADFVKKTNMRQVGLGDISIFWFIAIFSFAIIVSKVETWATIYRNYRHARWLSWYCFACVHSFYKNPKKFLQILENIVFKRIKTIFWIMYSHTSQANILYIASLQDARSAFHAFKRQTGQVFVPKCK